MRLICATRSKIVVSRKLPPLCNCRAPRKNLIPPSIIGSTPLDPCWTLLGSEREPWNVALRRISDPQRYGYRTPEGTAQYEWFASTTLFDSLNQTTTLSESGTIAPWFPTLILSHLPLSKEDSHGDEGLSTSTTPCTNVSFKLLLNNTEESM